MTSNTTTSNTTDPIAALSTDDPMYRSITEQPTRIARALEDYRRGQGARLDSAGRPIYADHSRRVAESTIGVDAAFSEAETAVADLARVAENTETREADFDPIGRLTADELATANTRRPFAREDAEQLAHTVLAARLRRELEDGDRPAQALLERYARRRLARDVTPGAESRRDQATTQAAEALARLVEEARARFRDGAAVRRSQAQRAAARAFSAELRRRCAEEADGLERGILAQRRRTGAIL